MTSQAHPTGTLQISLRSKDLHREFLIYPVEKHGGNKKGAGRKGKRERKKLFRAPALGLKSHSSSNSSKMVVCGQYY